jgi:hypothetical protein
VRTSWDYHSAWDTIAAAKDAITKDPGPHGGVIVERPLGIFHSVWLVRSDPSGKKSTPFAVR